MAIAIAFGLFGLIIGSFLNVVVYRHGTKSLGGRSECLSCGERIAWYDNIPVISWLVLRGRCRQCGSAISIQYPLVELSTGIIFALLGGASVPLDIWYRALLCLIASVLIAIAVYDLRHTIIPDRWAYAFAGLSLAAAGSLYLSLSHGSVWLYLAAGPIAAAPLFLLWIVSGGRWMGLGDAKLALGIGWLLGPAEGFFAVMFAFIIGALVSLPLLILSSRYWKRIVAVTPIRTSSKLPWGFTMRSEIPFGPFLVISCFIVWLLVLNGTDPLVALGLMPVW